MSIDFEGFQKRLRGYSIKDSVFIAQPCSKFDVKFITRLDTVDSITNSFIREGTGVLDIDTSRIGTNEELKGGSGVLWSHYRDGKVEEARAQANNLGRFPANFILQHDATCVCVGTKVVKGSHLDHSCGPTSPEKIYGHYSRTHYLGHTDENGNEQVEEWECSVTCPVRELDRQSGVRQSGKVLEHYQKKATNQDSIGGYEGGFVNDIPLTGFGDKGGASRFFKQVLSQDETERYLESLMRSK